MTATNAFTKTNYRIIAFGVLIVIAGFALMCGTGTTAAAFEPDIFSLRRIAVAPVVSLIGFLTIGFGIVFRKKS